MSGYVRISRIFLWVCIFGIFGDVATHMLNQNDVLNAAENLIRQYSNSSSSGNVGFTRSEFLTFLETATSHSSEFINKVLGACQSSDNCTHNPECPGTEEIFHSFAADGLLAPSGFIDAIPVALNTLTAKNCSLGDYDDEHGLHKRRNRRPTLGEAWGCSIAFASSVVIISNIGALLGPFMEKRFFKRIIQFLVAMGAGALASTGLLVLIPESFDIVAFEELEGYVWKGSVAVVSICFFFCSERILKVCLKKRKTAKFSTTIVEEPRSNGTDDLELLSTKSRPGADEGHGHSHLPPGADVGDRQTLAWMVMAGDVIHNFVDGLSIGAAFTEDFALGISISLAIICEELPHELADIAILLHSGLTMKKALLINFLSACWVYIGLVLGILMGSMIAEASKYIFAMAGALFLYVPLVDMLPDMNAHLDVLVSTGSSEAKVIAMLHAVGLIVGVGMVIFIVNISPYIVV